MTARIRQWNADPNSTSMSNLDPRCACDFGHQGGNSTSDRDRSARRHPSFSRLGVEFQDLEPFGPTEFLARNRAVGSLAHQPLPELPIRCGGILVVPLIAHRRWEGRSIPEVMRRHVPGARAGQARRGRECRASPTRRGGSVAFGVRVRGPRGQDRPGEIAGRRRLGSGEPTRAGGLSPTSCNRRVLRTARAT
jgi:hypothetical protein